MRPSTTKTEAFLGLVIWCAGRDSNPRRPKPPRLQRGVIDHSTTDAHLVRMRTPCDEIIAENRCEENNALGLDLRTSASITLPLRTLLHVERELAGLHIYLDGPSLDNGA